MAKYDQREIERAISFFCEPAWERGDVVELRALRTKRATVSGYFDSTDKSGIVSAAMAWSGDAQGVYITPNPVMRDCLARAANRLEWYAKHATGDEEITRRHWLLVDTDPSRPSGISATEAEHDLALQRASDIRDWLTSKGFPLPIFGDSSNGGHLDYRIDLPVDDGGLIQAVLKAIHGEFDGKGVEVDLKVHNPARIWKLYGTLSCKGDNMPDRPHRLARILDAPDTLEIVPRELLEDVAQVRTQTTVSVANNGKGDPLFDNLIAKLCRSTERVDVRAYLDAHGIGVRKTKDLGDGSTLYELERCVWRPDETDGGPFAIQFADGGATAGCHHHKCDGKGWPDFRDAVEPGWREKPVTLKEAALANGGAELANNRGFQFERAAQLLKATEAFDGQLDIPESHHDCPAQAKANNDGRLIVRVKAEDSPGAGWLKKQGWWEKVSDVSTTTDGNGKGASLAELLIGMSADDELFHNSKEQAYATVPSGETVGVTSKGYQLILRKRAYERGITVNRNAVDEAVATLETKAICDGTEEEVYVRTAEADGRLYLDLCNDAGEVVEVTADGWKIITKPPVKFIRKEGMEALPRPLKGGTVDELHQFLNVTDRDWHLLVAWLMAAIRYAGPFAILFVTGEQGSCKTTACRLIRSLVDPNAVPLRQPPNDVKRLMIAAANGHVIALDNLSKMPDWLSNALCSLSGGAGFSDRALYTDDDEKLYFYARPVMLNGIGDFLTRSDLLQRTLTVRLPVVPTTERKPERLIYRDFDEVRPRVLGALLTAAAKGLRRLPEIERRIEQQQSELPRLADFTAWIMAVEAALDWPEGTFLRVMAENESDANELVLSSSDLADTIKKLVGPRQKFHGTWSELFHDLSQLTEPRDRTAGGWPNPQKLSTKVRELAPNLRGAGISVEFHDTGRPKGIEIENGSAGGRECDLDASNRITLTHEASVVVNDARLLLDKLDGIRETDADAPAPAPSHPVASPSHLFPTYDGMQVE